MTSLGDELGPTQQSPNASSRAQKLSQHLENRPTVDELVDHNILKSFRADPSLHEVMQALIRTRRESELGSLLKKRRSLQDLIDKNILETGPPGSPRVRSARQKLLKHFRCSHLKTFLENRPSLLDVAKLNVLEDTLIWTRVLQMGIVPTPRNSCTLSSIDDCIYLTGGFCEGVGGVASSAELLCFNTSSDTWSRPLCAGALPSDRFAHTSCTIGKQLVIFGGCTSRGNWLNDVHVLDTEFEQPLVPKHEVVGHKWKQLVPQTMFLWYAPETTGAKPCPRAAHSATSVGTRMIVFGGNDGVRFFNDVHILEVEAMGWSKPKVRGTPPSPRAGHAAALIDGHLLYVFGGGTAHGPTNSIHVLDLETLTWTDPPISGTPPSPRVGHSMQVVDGPGPQLLVFGGGTIDKLFDDLHVFDWRSGVWSRPRDTGTVPMSRTGHACCLVRDPVSASESMYYFGGAGSQGQLNDMYLLDCAFFSTAVQTVPDGAICGQSVFKDDQEELGDAFSPKEQCAAWYDKVEPTRFRLEQMLGAVKNKLVLVQKNTKLREQQLAASLQSSLEGIRGELDAISELVHSELSAGAGTPTKPPPVVASSCEPPQEGEDEDAPVESGASATTPN